MENSSKVVGSHEANDIVEDAQRRQNQRDELILMMGTKKYKLQCLKMRPRTLLDKMDISNRLIKDDSVQIQLRQDCEFETCKGQLLEPKLKKSLMSVQLDPGTTDLSDMPRCTYCGKPIKIPTLKIIHGGFSRTFREDRIKRHKIIEVSFFSANQILKKVEKLVRTSRGKLNQNDVAVFRHTNAELFWNVVHYLNNHDLPYDMFLPYKDTSAIEEFESQFNQLNSQCMVNFKEGSKVHSMNKKEKDNAEMMRKTPSNMA